VRRVRRRAERAGRRVRGGALVRCARSARSSSTHAAQVRGHSAHALSHADASPHGCRACAGCVPAAPQARAGAGAACASCGERLSRGAPVPAAAALIGKMAVRCPNTLPARSAAGAKHAREDDEDEEEDSNGCAWKGAVGDIAAHVGACPLQLVACSHAGCAVRTARCALAAHGAACAQRLLACAHCAAPFTQAALAAHAGRCAHERVRCAVRGCAESCTHAQLAAQGPLGAAHGAHVVALAARLAQADAAATASEAAAAAREADAHAALRRQPAEPALAAAAQHGSLRELAALMRAHAGDAAAHVHACEHLQNTLLPALPPADMRAALDAGIVPILLAAMRAHPADVDVQRGSLYALGVLSAECDASRAAAGMDALDACIAAMQHHGLDARVCELGCGLVSNMTDAHPARGAHAGARGAVGLVVRTLADGGALRADARRAAARALANLLASDTPGDAHAQAAVCAGGVPAVLTALKTFPKYDDLQRSCGCALERMTTTPAGCAAASAAGALAVALAALRARRDGVWTAHSFCGVLANLVHAHPANAAAAVKSGAVGLALAALRAHGAADTWVVRHACLALCNLLQQCGVAARQKALSASAARDARKVLRAAADAAAGRDDDEAADAARAALRMLEE
jgi:hypothetical protein